MIPRFLSKAQVVSVDPDNYSVYVYLFQQGGEGPIQPVRVLCPGPCDGLRIFQPPLPTRGTMGVVAAVDGDTRALVWLGSLPINAQDAITTIPGQNNIRYEAHWSGFYSLLDEEGNTTLEWPDGTNLVVGPTSGQPTRHIINSQNARVSVPVLQADRVGTVPSPFPLTYTHPTGTQINIDGSGNVLVNGVANVTVSGAASVNVSGATVINIYSPNTVNLNTTNFNVTGSMNLYGSFNAIGEGGGETTFNVSGAINATQEITASAGSNNVKVSAHTHGGIQTGSSHTDPPDPNT